MESDRLRRAIADQREELSEKFKRENIVQREFLPEIKDALSVPGLLVLTGVRRCGKSFASVLSSGEDYGYVNFDDPSLEGIRAKDLPDVMEAMYMVYGKPGTIILDEVQNVSGWELLATRLRETKRTIVTGSNASLLSEEFGTRLTGRYVRFEAMPFSFREFLAYNNVNAKPMTTEAIAEIKKRLEDYVRRGGFPESYKYGERMLLQIYEDIVTKDIERRYNIRNRTRFREFARDVLSNSANRISYNSLADAFRLGSVNTAKKYLSYIENAYLVIVIRKFSNRLRHQFRAPKKVYCIDNGLLSALGFRIMDNTPKIMENIVCIELMRRKSYLEPTTEVYYWQDQFQREVDFIVRKGDRTLELIQVTNDFNKINENREVRSLLAASRELRCGNLTVITWNTERTIKKSGKVIRLVPLWKWLLKENSPERMRKHQN